MAIIDLGKAEEKASEDQFWAMRGHAIQAYATVEQSLCGLFAMLVEVKSDIAGMIFFKLSGHNRKKLFRDLISKKYGDVYQKYWDSLEKLLEKATRDRNDIVHWHSAIFVKSENDVTPKLVHPNFGDFNPGKKAIITDDLSNFICKCNFIARSCNMFRSLLLGELDEENKQVWQNICQQPAVYPPTNTHPLFTTNKIRLNQLMVVQ